MSKSKRNTRKKKIDWSKILSSLICLVFGGYGIWCGIEYNRLCELAIEN